MKRRTVYLYPIALFTVCVLAYLLQVRSLGFYWDDWQAVYLYYSRSIPLLNAYFAFDRPFSAWTYQVTFPLLGMSPIAWQIFSVFIRWLGIWCLVEGLILIWPNEKAIFQWTGFLVIVYPGFNLQFVSVAFSQHFITFLAYAASIYFHALALKNRHAQGLFYCLALIFASVHLFSMEYFVGLEIIRPILIWAALKPSNSDEAKKRPIILRAFANWAPFLLLVCAYFFWRFIYFPKAAPAALENQLILFNAILASPIKQTIVLLSHIVQDNVYLFVFSWLEAIKPEILDMAAKMVYFSFGAGVLAAFIAVKTVDKLTINTQSGNDKPQNLPLLSGFFALFFGAAPFWLANRQIIVGKWSERFAMAPMVGAVLITVIAIHHLTMNAKKRSMLLALLMTLAVAYQVQSGNSFRLDWANQRDFYWQMLWRIPALQDQTAIFGSYIPTGLEADYSIGFGLSTLYHTKSIGQVAPTWFFTPRSVGTAIPILKTDMPIQSAMRNIKFEGSTSQAVPIAYNYGDRCLRVLDPIYRADPNLAKETQQLFDLYNPAAVSYQVLPIQEIPKWLGNEVEHTWCYYFQQADIAREKKDWQAAIDWTYQAFDAGYGPKTGGELLPLIISSANLNQWENAVKAILQAAEIDKLNPQYLCTTWKELQKLPAYSSLPDSQEETILNTLNCPEK